MDVRVLRSLTTCALYPYLEGKSSESGAHDGGKEANGAEFPDDVADTVLGVPHGGASTYHAPTFFSIGLDFALEIAAAITDDPAHSPDISVPIAKAKSRIAEAIKEAA
jgi:hypothetical protein